MGHVCAAANETAKGFGIEVWLARFYDPANYPEDARCALFRARRLMGFLDGFEQAMRLAFAVPASTVEAGHANFSVALLAVPLSSARREQTHVVRKSTDAIYLHDECCGQRNTWLHSLDALMTQAVTMALEAVASEMASREGGRGGGGGGGGGDAAGVTAADRMEVALWAVRSLEDLCEHVPGFRGLLDARAASEWRRKSPRPEATVLRAVLGLLLGRAEGRDPPSPPSVTSVAAGALRAWYPFSRESDIHVAARHALRHTALPVVRK